MPMSSMARPVAPVRRANTSAPLFEIKPRTKGRLRVLDMRASDLGSNSMLKALAEAQERKVPVVRKSRVKVEVERLVLVADSIAVAVLCRRSGVGYSEYADVVVSTIKNDSRGLDKDK